MGLAKIRVIHGGATEMYAAIPFTMKRSTFPMTGDTSEDVTARQGS